MNFSIKDWLARLTAPSVWFERLFNRPEPSSGLCPECGHQGRAERVKRGRDDLEVILWALLAVFTVAYVVGYGIKYAAPQFPGFFIRAAGLLGKACLAFGGLYTLWRLSTDYEACPHCHHTPLVPPDSPKGRKVLKELGQPPAGE